MGAEEEEVGSGDGDEEEEEFRGTPEDAASGQFKLINEAIKRILLDVVIRGHGDRLIGRWSREPEIQKFLEDVPYLLDRISQLHLCCSRVAPLGLVHSSHPQYHHRHHRHNHRPAHRHRSASPEASALRAFRDFISLIGNKHHWLVRTRDQLGLTPLHKAVLFHNKPVAEYIADRYADELAPPSNWRGANWRPGPGRVRLLDAQDKYGRTALHYAAAAAGTSSETPQHPRPKPHLYRFLVARGASEQVEDFQGKRAPFYLEQPEKLRARSIIHLANKLNASYQATVLGKTLRAGRLQGRLGDILLATPLEVGSQVVGVGPVGGAGVSGPATSGCLLSVSCSELAGVAEQDEDRYAPAARPKSNSSTNLAQQHESQPPPNEFADNDQDECPPTPSPPPQPLEGGRVEFVGLPEQEALTQVQLEAAKRQLVGRRTSRPVLDEATRQSIKRALNEGVVERITELACSGFGAYIVGEARASCWNQQCRRYVERLLPQLLDALDVLHEAVALDQVEQVEALLTREPILARIRRPYRPGALSSLHVAAQLDRRRLVGLLASRFPELVHEPDSRGATCLHWAARLPCGQLYHWLLARYGGQLESIRDARGRLAADYIHTRRNAEKPVRLPHADSDNLYVDELLSRNREQLKELRLVGQKEPVRVRVARVPNQGRKVPPQPKEIEAEEAPRVEEQQQHNSFTGSGLLDTPQRSPESEPADRAAKEPEAESGVVSPEAGGEQQETHTMSDEQVLMGEMTQLGLSDKAGSAESLADPVASRAAESSINRIQSVLGKAIEADDTRPIERLILAGCGRTVMELYDVRDHPFDRELSEQVAAYMSRNAPKLVSLVQEIHAKVHVFFAKTESSQQSNQCFNSICKLLSCNSLCMSRDCFGATPLQVSLMRSDRRLAEYLLRRQLEAASGPDHLNRSSLHYAAIALRAFTGHGPFKLSLSDAPPGSYWLVDETSQILYDNLKQRFEDLLELRDRKGNTCEDYLKECAHKPALDELPVGLVEPHVAFGECCPDYAQLLANYNYFVLVEGDMIDPVESNDNQEPEVNLPGRSMSCETEPEPELEAQKRAEKVSRRSSTLDDLLSPVDIHVPATPDWDPKGPLRQLAPLPTVGSSSGFQEGPSPVLSSSTRRSGECKKSSGSRNSNRTTTKFNHSTSGRQKRSSVKQASVGGVIVPTIIHDASKDIETYDIVSRNNSASPPQKSTRASSRLSNHSSSEDLLKTLDPRRLITPASMHTSSIVSPNKFVFDEESSDSSSSSSSANEADVSRVEHLSDEFQNRVRIEKNELRKRVDQIMNEIKMSAKSSNSSRVLMSPSEHSPIKHTPTATSNHLALGAGSLVSIKHSTGSLTTSLSASSVSSCSSSNCSRKVGASTQTEEASRTSVDESGHQPELQVLKENELATKNSYGQTYLHFIASRSQAPSTFYKVLEHGRHLLGERDIYYRSARDVAVQFNLANNVQVLDKFVIGLFVNGHKIALQQLLNQGYSPLIHVADADGNDIMMILKLLKLDRMVQFLLQMADFQRWRDELHTFIRHGYLGGVQELIKKNNDLIKAKSVHSRSSLHLAVLFNRVEMIDLLLAHDPSSICVTDNMNRTPLHYAFGVIHAYNSDEIKQKLMDAGADKAMRDVKMRTPNYYYIFRRDIDEIRRMELELN